MYKRIGNTVGGEGWEEQIRIDREGERRVRVGNLQYRRKGWKRGRIG